MKKYAIITGASRGIGKTLVEELIKQTPGLVIFTIARTKDALTSLAKAYPDQVIWNLSVFIFFSFNLILLSLIPSSRVI